MDILNASREEIEAHNAAKQRVVEVALNQRGSNQELIKSNDDMEQKLAAMQMVFDRLLLLRQVYYEAPNDVFELIVLHCRFLCEEWWGSGGLNALRLANKRCKQVVESCTTRLTNQIEDDGPYSLPRSIVERCRGIEEIHCIKIEDIRCSNHNLRSLEGCPDGLKKLVIGHASHLSELSPLASCSRMQHLEIFDSFITDVSVVSSMPLLEVFVCQKSLVGRPSIKDLSPLSFCPLLKTLDLLGNRELKDLSPLSACTALERLIINHCDLITSLVPLSNLKCLQELRSRFIDPQTSLLPLTSCFGLKILHCRVNAVHLEDVRKRAPHLQILH